MNLAGQTTEKNNGAAGRWRNNSGFKPDVDFQATGRQMREKRNSKPFFSHLSIDAEIRICLRYLADEDYRLTKISQDIRTRPAKVREMLTSYGIDIRNRVFNS